MVKENEGFANHGTLKKVSFNKGGLRTREASGLFENKPVVGKGFRLVCPPHISGAMMRLIITTPVVEIVSDEVGFVKFKTENSEYELTY